MAAGVVTLEARVESVLVDLVRAATAELTKLFESRYQASAGAAGRAVAGGWEPSRARGDATRSIGVQVDADVCPLVFPELPLLSDATSLNACKPVAFEGHTDPTETILDEVNDHADPHWSPTMEQIVAETLDMVGFRILDMGPDAESLAEADLLVAKEPKTEPSWCEHEPSSSDEQRPLVVHPEQNQPACEGDVDLVYPLIRKLDSLQHVSDTSKKRVKIEPGATKGAQKARGRQKNNPSIKLDPHFNDPKLLIRCTVPLVNVISCPKSGAQNQTDADGEHTADKKGGFRLPRDLCSHQGPHNGRRLCCYTNCGNGLWRLVKGVIHTRDGYACRTCGKIFKRRKILRRHKRFHSGEKPYSCKLCPKTFALRKSLRRHLRFHTGERPHACSECGKSFRLRENLKVHLRFHTGEKPFVCSVCGKTFRIQRSLETHRLSQCDAFIPSFRAIAGIKTVKT